MFSLVSSRQQPLAPLSSCESCGVWGTLNEGGSGCYWAGVWVVFQRSIHCYSCGRLGGSNPFGDPALQLPLPGLCPLSAHSQIKSSRCATRILFTVDSSPVRVQRASFQLPAVSAPYPPFSHSTSRRTIQDITFKQQVARAKWQATISHRRCKPTILRIQRQST